MELNKKRIFYVFLILNAIFWTVIQLLRNLISIDSMEAIVWGELISFGTNKHPPLSGWLMSSFYNLFGQHDILVYLLGQICILVGFIFTYKLAKFFVSQEKAFCSVMILEACFYYSYCIYLDNYNCNVILMALVPMVAYYFYKSVKENRLKDWVLFGLVSGLAFLGKYQIVFLFFGMFLYLLLANREQFKRKGMYIAILVGTLVILPHVIWLFNTDFFSFTYMIERTESETHNMPLILVKLSHIVYPVKFIGDQILAVLPCVALYLIMALQAKNIGFKNENKSDGIFLLSIGVVPIIAQGLMGAITGSRVPGIWGSIMVGFSGILLFYFLSVKFNKDTFIYFVKWAYAALFVSLISVGIFAVLNTKYFIKFPYQTIIPEMNKIWAERTDNAELKYVGGDMCYVFQFRIYNPKHPKVILETFGHKNPWVNHEDVLKSGVLVIGIDEEDAIARARDLVYLLPKDYEIKADEYKFEVCNILKKCSEESFFYTIIK